MSCSMMYSLLLQTWQMRSCQAHMLHSYTWYAPPTNQFGLPNVPTNSLSKLCRASHHNAQGHYKPSGNLVNQLSHSHPILDSQLAPALSIVVE